MEDVRACVRECDKKKDHPARRENKSDSIADKTWTIGGAAGISVDDDRVKNLAKVKSTMYCSETLSIPDLVNYALPNFRQESDGRKPAANPTRS